MALITIHPGLENRPNFRGEITSRYKPQSFFERRKYNAVKVQHWASLRAKTHFRSFGMKPDMGV